MSAEIEEFGALRADGPCSTCGGRPRVRHTMLCADCYAATLERVREAMTQRPSGSAVRAPKPTPTAGPPKPRRPPRAEAIERLTALVAERGQIDRRDVPALLDTSTRTAGRVIAEAIEAGHIRADRRTLTPKENHHADAA